MSNMCAGRIQSFSHASFNLSVSKSFDFSAGEFVSVSVVVKSLIWNILMNTNTWNNNLSGFISSRLCILGLC